MSNTIPSFVQTGSSKGKSESEQQLNGNLAMGTLSRSFLPPHSYLCSAAVMKSRSLLCLFFPILFAF